MSLSLCPDVTTVSFKVASFVPIFWVASALSRSCSGATHLVLWSSISCIKAFIKDSIMICSNRQQFSHLARIMQTVLLTFFRNILHAPGFNPSYYLFCIFYEIACYKHQGCRFILHCNLLPVPYYCISTSIQFTFITIHTCCPDLTFLLLQHINKYFWYSPKTWIWYSPKSWISLAWYVPRVRLISHIHFFRRKLVLNSV